MSARQNSKLKDLFKSPGFLSGLPAVIFLIFGFLGPLTIVLLFSFMPSKTFSLMQMPTLENYAQLFKDSYYLSFEWSLFLAFVTVVLSFLICYPIAYGMVRIFGKWANLVTALIAIPILISENIRLFGWVLIFLKNGVLDGMLQYMFGVSYSGFLYTVPAILLGMIYVYLPYMLFPLVMGIALVPESLKEAASDMGATRFQVFREVELPLSMPGILIGSILTFILSLGALVESKILGGQAVILIADDIENAFTFAQDWPRGAMLSVLLIGLSGIIVFFLMRRINLDQLVGKR